MPLVELPVTYSPITGSSHFVAETMSLQPSPSAPVCTVEPRLPLAIKRPDKPRPYSCAMTSPSNAPSRLGNPAWNMYICIREEVPSAAVLKLALLTQRLGPLQCFTTPSS